MTTLLKHVGIAGIGIGIGFYVIATVMAAFYSNVGMVFTYFFIGVVFNLVGLVGLWADRLRPKTSNLDEAKQPATAKRVPVREKDVSAIVAKNVNAEKGTGVSQIRCGNCGSMNDLDAVFCKKCGQRFRVGVPSDITKAAMISAKELEVTREGETINEAAMFTFLVKSEKYGKICLACVDEHKRWVRPIKSGGFDEKDILMDNGEPIHLFDVVDMRFAAPFPIKHHKENVLFSPGSRMRYVRTLGENEQSSLLSEIANPQILNEVKSREELFDEMSLNLAQSLVLTGPISLFDIQCSILGKNHPRIWIVGQNDGQRIFSIPCTDLRFCKFVDNRLSYLRETEGIVSSQDVPELRGKQTYFVIRFDWRFP